MPLLCGDLAPMGSAPRNVFADALLSVALKDSGPLWRDTERKIDGSRFLEGRARLHFRN